MKPSLFLAFVLLLAATPLLAQTPTPTCACCIPVTVFGAPGSLLGQLNGPNGMAAAGTTLYVADQPNARIARFTTSGAPVGPALTAGGSLVSPFDVAVLGSYLLVCDTGRGQVLKLDPANDQFTPVVTPAPTQTPAVPFSGAWVDAQGDLYMTVANGPPLGAVVKWRETSPGVFTQAASISGFAFPNDVHTSDDGVTLYVVDTANNQILEYQESPPGSDNYTFSSVAVPAVTATVVPGKLSWPYQMARDGAGNFYVTDVSDRHQVFDPNWNFLAECYSVATPESNTVGIAVDSQGEVFRGSGYNSNIAKLSSFLPTPTPTPTLVATPTATPSPPLVHCDESYAYPNPAVGWTLRLHLQLCQPGRLSLFLYNVTGEMVGQSAYDGLSGANDLALSIQGWAPGVYFYRFEIEDSGGKRHLKPVKFAIR